jgi:hypothetical protein
MKDVLPAAAGLSGVFVSFAGTSKAILLAMPSSETLKRIKKIKAFSFIVAHFFDTVALGLITCTLSVAGLWFEWTTPSREALLVLSLIGGASLGTLMSVALSAHYLHKLLMAVADE